MPFTLAHPAVVLPLLRRPFVPAALVAGSMAPDVPYYLTAAGITSTRAGDWYGPLLNATHTHSLTGLPIDLLYAAALVAVYRLMRAPITALLPTGLALPQRSRPTSPQYYGWLLLSALIGVATHILWDAFTDADFLPSRLLQYASTAFGLAVIGWYLWQRRDQLRANGAHHLGTKTRRLVVAALIAAPLLGAAALARDDYDSYRAVTASWAEVAEGVLTGAAKRAGAAFAVALLVYTIVWHLTAYRRRIETGIHPGNIKLP